MKLERFLLVRLHDKSAIFYSTENVHAYESGHVSFLGETFFASSNIAYWPLAVSMPPTKVCPQCKAAVPVRRKTCERCDLVFFEKQSVICERKQFNYKTYGSSRIR